MTIIVWKKMKFSEALKNARDIEKWFRDNPKKKICKTDLFEIRKGYLIEDILEHTKELKNK